MGQLASQMQHRGEQFVDEEIHVGGNQYIECGFERCRIIYDGSPGVAFKRCSFEDTRLELSSEAGNTISFLQNIYHGFGETGEAVVENIFEQVRAGRIGLGAPAEKPGPR